MAHLKASDFTPGSSIKVVGPFTRSEWAHLRRFIGWYGRVLEPKYSKRLVLVSFEPDRDWHFPAKSLERGRVEWVPENA